MPCPLMSCGIADHGRFGNLAMGAPGAFDLGGAHAMAGHIDHIIDTTGNPVIAVFVTPAPVTGEILALVGARNRSDEAFVIAIDRAHLAGPGIGQAQIARRSAFKHVAVGIDQMRLNAKERPRRRARLESVAPGSGVIMMPPVSVCHQVSTIGHRSSPTTIEYHRQASGLIGSPTEPSSADRADGRFTWSSPSRIKARMAVGAV